MPCHAEQRTAVRIGTHVLLHLYAVAVCGVSLLLAYVLHQSRRRPLARHIRATLAEWLQLAVVFSGCVHLYTAAEGFTTIMRCVSEHIAPANAEATFSDIRHHNTTEGGWTTTTAWPHPLWHAT